MAKKAVKKAAKKAVKATKSKKPAASAKPKVAAKKAGRAPVAGKPVKPAPRVKASVPAKPSKRAKAAAPVIYANVGDASVLKATGKGWADWLLALDAANARTMEHSAIAKWLRDEHKVGDWWCQMVTVGYEQARGLRQKNETPDGFQASMSKTIGAPISRLYRAWEDAGERARWLGEVPVEIRTSTPDKSIRLTWNAKGAEQGSSVEVYFWFREAARTMVQVQQRKLADAAAVDRVKAFWSVKLEALRAFMEKGR
ncbi:MAG: DUF4287 domain-containing protein [Planctomycetota bacterium]